MTDYKSSPEYMRLCLSKKIWPKRNQRVSNERNAPTWATWYRDRFNESLEEYRDRIKRDKDNA